MVQRSDAGRGAIRGLYLRTYDSGRSVWWLRYTTAAGQRKTVRVGIGERPLKEIRARARELLVEVDRGGDPSKDREDVRNAWTVDVLLTECMRRHWAIKCRETTQREILRLSGKVIRPKLGKIRITQLTPEMVADWHSSVGASTPGQANRALAALSKACSLAITWGKIGTNPCKSVQRFEERKIQRYLSEDEYERLFDVLDSATEHDPYAIQAIGLLAFSGWRRGETLRIRWPDVDLRNGRVLLRDTKAGGDRWADLNDQSAAILRAIPRNDGIEWVFPRRLHGRNSTRLNTPMDPNTVNKVWEKVRKVAGLENVRLHDLRHAFASMAAAEGVPLLTIGKLLGHRSVITTDRYAHLTDRETSAATVSVGRRIARTKK